MRQHSANRAGGRRLGITKRQVRQAARPVTFEMQATALYFLLHASSDTRIVTDCKRSLCPVSCFLDIVGDKWTLLVVRDLLLGKHTFKEFQASPENIPATSWRIGSNASSARA